MKVALDTNAIVDFFRGNESMQKHLQQCETILLPFITIAELRAGFLCGKKGLENERTLTRLLSSPRVEILFPNEDTTHHYARLFYQLRKQGTPIPTNDLWIGALCLQHDLPLVSSDKHFEHIPQLIVNHV